MRVVLCFLVTFGIFQCAAESGIAGDLFNLDQWKLTLPYDTGRKGRPDEVLQPELQTFRDPNCFFVSQQGDAFVFRASCGGLATVASKYPRCELREMQANGKDEVGWSTDDGRRHVMLIEQAISHVPEVKPHVVCAQIHDSSDDVIMIRLEGKKLFVERNGGEDVRLDSNYELGKTFVLQIATGDGRIQVLYNGESKMDWEVSKDDCYFRAGCYTQSNVKKGDSPDAYGEVVIFRLQVHHDAGR